jgi:class 3 adenylate cyclase/HAMP domain-containing protein
MNDGSSNLAAQATGTAGPPLRSRLFLKYVMLFVAVVSLALLANSVSEAWFTYQEHKAALTRIQREQAETAATKIGQFIKGIEGQLGWTTQLPWTASAIEQRRFDALRLLRQVPAITELSQLDAAGREQLRVSRLAMDVVGSKADFSSDAKFTEAVAHKIYYGPVYFRRESEPYMTLALAGTRRDAGVSVAEVNLKFIWDVVSQIKVGERGQAYVVDASARLIAHPDISLVLRNTDLSRFAQVRAAYVSGADPSTQSVQIVTDLQGRQVLTAYAAIAPLGWFMFVELPLDEANAALYTSIKRSVLLLSVGLALAIAAGLFLARRMVVPIQALRVGAALVGSGDLTQRISIKTGDELEGLADQFNDMANRLQESYANLEKKVDLRTRELSEALKHINELHSKVSAQASELATWNKTLEQRVADQLGEIERVSRLKRFLTPQVAEMVLSSGDESILASHRREVSVIFCDLRGFTAFAESTEPEEVMSVLGEYHACLGALIHKHEATLERFAGDGLMMLFNDPLPCSEPAARAVRMAMEMRDAVAGLIVKWRKHGHQLGFGMGITHGYATIGRIGFEGRLDYSAIGSVVNLAARLCGEAAAGQILVDNKVQLAIEAIAETEPVGDLTLKGFSRPVPAFDIRALRS